MAFENLLPYRDEIIALRRPGPGQKTLVDVSDWLFEKHKVRTTPASLSRFLKELKQPPGIAAPELNPSDKIALDSVAVLTEVLVEIRGRGDEQRVVIEHLAGQLAIQTKAIEELEKQVAKSATDTQTSQPDAALVRQIWFRAFAVSLVVVGLAATAIMMGLR